MITDPALYAVAVPAVLLVGLAKSGFASGFGALAVPVMSLAVPVPQAAAIMLPLLVIMDFMGLAALAKHADRSLIKLLLPTGLVGILVGTASFGLMKASTVAGVVGALTLTFLAIRTLFPPKADSPPPRPWVGGLLGMASGFTSFVSHAGGPPLGFYLLPQKLPPLVFAGTSAVFFTVINLSKWPSYGALGLIDLTNMSTSLVLAPVAPLGVWTGLRLSKRVSTTWFYRMFLTGMFCAGCKLLWDGLRPWLAGAGA
ncbi:putative permease [Burkholderiales bacterium JOSHI_001]|nr:putative permease [Burkholderiales bacterium JOSHI_001]